MMEARDDGGPAFPELKRLIEYTEFGDEITGRRFDADARSGMSLRDWFAGQALIGICSQEDERKLAKDSPVPVDEWRRGCAGDDAAYAYRLADAMLKERSK